MSFNSRIEVKIFVLLHHQLCMFNFDKDLTVHEILICQLILLLVNYMKYQY